MPDYIVKDNPDAQFLSLKVKMSKQPKSVDRPPAATFESTIRQYYIKHLAKNRKKNKTIDRNDPNSELRANLNYIKLFGTENLTLDQLNFNKKHNSSLGLKKKTTTLSTHTQKQYETEASEKPLTPETEP